MTRIDAARMLKRRLANAGITGSHSPHSFRASGLTRFLEEGGTLEGAQNIADHADSRIINFYDRRQQIVLRENDLLPSIVEIDDPTVRVIGDVLRSLERATFLKKASESASPERERRVTTTNPGLRQAPVQHPGCINPGHRSPTQFPAVPPRRAQQPPRETAPQSNTS